jgi:hypothetical protein
LTIPDDDDGFLRLRSAAYYSEGVIQLQGSTATTAGTPATTTTTVPPSPTAGVGVWTDVTPAGFNRSPDAVQTAGNYGFMNVLVDPARPSDLYTFTNS